MPVAAKPRSKPGPKPSSDRLPNEFLIRQRMLEPLKQGRRAMTIYELNDKVNAILGHTVTYTLVHYVITGRRQPLAIQKAVARALGLKFDEAFPKEGGKENHG